MKGETHTTDNSTYLGSTLSCTVNKDGEVNNKIAKGGAAFERLHENVWEHRGLCLTTNLTVYRVVVLTTLLYASETWTIYSTHAKQLNHFHLTCLSCLRRLIHIR